jgi:hypothetical protein
MATARYEYSRTTHESMLIDDSIPRQPPAFDQNVICSLPGRVSKKSLIEHYNECSERAFDLDYTLEG